VITEGEIAMAARVALIQMQGNACKAANIEMAKRYIGEAAARGANVICLQELFSTAYFCYEEKEEYWSLAEPVPGPTIDTMAELAKGHGIVLVAPIYEQVVPGELYNTAVVLGPDGGIIGRYRKSSIPMVKKPSMIGSEKYYFKPGNTGFEVFPTPFGINLGILICYDRHFPEAARLLALRGADVVLIPTATAGTSRHMWEIELRAHAMTNVYYVGGVNRVGKDIGGAPDTHYYGCSFLCDYHGDILSQAGDQEDQIIYADIGPDDLQEMARLRGEWGFFRDRRPDLYGDLLR
jgi:beta-ureidopropionase